MPKRPVPLQSCRGVGFLALACLSLAGTPTVRAEESFSEFKDKIEAEVKAIKEKYETKIQGLEERVESLENENAQLKRQKSSSTASNHPSSSASEVASLRKRVTRLEAEKKEAPIAAGPDENAQAAPDPIRKIQTRLKESETETQYIYREEGWPFDMAKQLYKLPRPFEFHGYFRSGFGLNGEEGKMEAFKAPGAGAKYRLGNESETYGEISLTNNWLLEDDPTKAPYVKSVVMMSFSTGENFSYDSLNNQAQGNDIALRQAYVEGGNVFQSIPEIRFWGGQRYYRRHDIHINDFYYLDMSGYGGGVEDIPLGSFAKLQAAWLGGSVDNYITDHGNAAKHNLDIRLTDIKVLAGKLTFWLDYARTRGGETRNVFDPNGNPLSIETSSGWAIGLIHRTNEPTTETVEAKDGKGMIPVQKTSGGFLGGYNDFSIQYGSGAAYNFQSTLDTSSPDLDDAWRFRVTDHFTIQPCDRFAMQAVGLYEETEYGGPNSRQKWASLGMRPVYYFSDRFSIALEAGVDWAKSEPMGTDGHLWKITLAPQLSRGGKFFSRPQLRAFVTYAKWSDDFRGLVGGVPYEDATEGLSYGLQLETWW